MTAIAVRVVELITAENIFRHLLVIPFDKEGKVQRHCSSVLKCVGVLPALNFSGWSSSGVLQRKNPRDDLLKLLILQIGVWRHRNIAPTSGSAFTNTVSQLFNGIGLGGPYDLTIAGMTGAAVAGGEHGFDIHAAGSSLGSGLPGFCRPGLCLDRLYREYCSGENGHRAPYVPDLPHAG